MLAVRKLLNGKLALATSMAITLTCGMCPGLASAAQLEAGQPSALDSTIATHAATKTVYVITSSAETLWAPEGDIAPVITEKYTYNKNGLVTKRVNTNNIQGGKVTTTFSYNGTTLKNKRGKQDNLVSNVTYTANKRGLITKAVLKTSRLNGDKSASTRTAKYKSGKISKIIIKSSQASGETRTSQAAFTYKNGRVVTRVSGTSRLIYAYDAKGNLKLVGGGQYKNTYNAKKLLSKVSEVGDMSKKTFKYKAIKVKASIADKVKAQQWAIINRNLNFALGIDEISI